MFKLQRLEITGFKSFADYTEIVFTGDGITAVVGPNGCGKSNIAESIAWVLGEQKVKNLRSSEMKDVIFQGARNRAPSGMAEVVMHLVRDETVLAEQELEDLDSALEEIDEHAVTLESETDPLAQGDAQLVIDTDVPANLIVDAEAVAADQSANADAVVGVGAHDAVVAEAETAALGADQNIANAEQRSKRMASKRHWRPSRMALEFTPGESVAVTRRLYRSGESEYLLNGRVCRLRDIQDLFSGTGLSGAHYAIIEQGRIGQILSAKPMERRTMIEEAAGISKFRVRQRAAEARLDSARGNLSRVSDIIAEIDRQVNSLRRQAAKAKRYRVLREELRDLLRNVYVAEESTLSALLEQTSQQLTLAASEEESLAQRLQSCEESARNATQEARSLEDVLARTRAAAAEAELQRDRRARELAYQQQQAEALTLRRTEVLRDSEAIIERVELVESACANLRIHDASERNAADESAERLSSAETKYTETLHEAAVVDADIEATRVELLQHTAVAERLREISRQLESALERLALQLDGLEKEGERARAQHGERVHDAEALQQEIVVARARLAALVEERDQAAHAVARARDDAKNAEQVLQQARDESTRVQHRFDTLAELDAQRALYSSTVQRLLSQEDGPADVHFLGTLADAVRVEPKWEQAIEGAFGPMLQALLVPTPDDAARAAAWLRTIDAGRANFIVAGLHGGAESAALVEDTNQVGPPVALESTCIADVIGVSPQLKTVLARIFTAEMNAQVVETLDQAVALSLSNAGMCITLAGDCVRAGQLITAGIVRAQDGAGLLALRRELRDLAARTDGLAAAVAAAELAFASAQTLVVEREDTVVQLNEIIGRDERAAMSLDMTAENLAQEIDRAARHLNVVAEDSARVAQEIEQLRVRREAAVRDAESAESARIAASDRIAERSQLLAEYRKQAEADNEALGQQRAAAAAATERRRAVSAELRRMEAEQIELESRRDRHHLELTEISARLQALELSLAELDQSADVIESEREREAADISSAAANLMTARASADQHALELSDLNQRAAIARDNRAGLDVQRAEAGARLSFVRTSCATELGEQLAELAQQHRVDEEFDLDLGRERVEDMRARIEGFGAVNMMALEELSESEERFVFLTGQRQDIVDGISSTEEALREIKRRSRERFREAFEEVNRNFSEFFHQLFGGGRGEMSLIEADDILESGIDVIAQPPGKRLQNVLLLSGGEKAMAALALVLAIFKFRPSPFCLLDEVDAPLDEANVGRFTDKISEMSSQTQFLVITHNKRTMEMARALYGVTMEEPGVSKLVSVKFG